MNLLYNLFQLTDQRLNQAQRNQILTALKDNLGTMIQNGNQLYNLFKLN